MMLNVKQILTTTALLSSFIISLSSVQAMDNEKERLEEVRGNIIFRDLQEGEYFRRYTNGTMEAAFRIGTLEEFFQPSVGHDPVVFDNRFSLICSRQKQNRFWGSLESHSSIIVKGHQQCRKQPLSFTFYVNDEEFAEWFISPKSIYFFNELLTTTALHSSFIISLSSVQAMDNGKERLEEVRGNIISRDLQEGEYFRRYTNGTMEAAFRISTLEEFSQHSFGQDPVVFDNRFSLICSRVQRNRFLDSLESHSSIIVKGHQQCRKQKFVSFTFDVNEKEFAEWLISPKSMYFFNAPQLTQK